MSFFWAPAASGVAALSCSAPSRKIINIDGTDRIELDASSQLTATSFPGTTVVYVDASSTSAVVDTGWHFVTITDTTGVNASVFEIGRGGATFYDGRLDDVRVYDRALSPGEIQQLYTLGQVIIRP